MKVYFAPLLLIVALVTDGTPVVYPTFTASSDQIASFQVTEMANKRFIQWSATESGWIDAAILDWLAQLKLDGKSLVENMAFPPYLANNLGITQTLIDSLERTRFGPGYIDLTSHVDSSTSSTSSVSVLVPQLDEPLVV